MEIMIYYTTLLCLLSTFAKTQYPPYYQNQLRTYDHYDIGPMDNMYDDYDDSSECECSCQICEDIKPCCRNVCVNCFQQPQSSIVIVPYPYPLIISTKQKETASTPQATEQTIAPQVTEQAATEAPPDPEPKIETTLSTTTTTLEPETSPPELLRNKDAYINDIIAKAPHINDRNKFVLTSLRRTKPNWMPKYGIVPIPENLAEKLMLQLRSMRVLHPRKETFKATDTLSSLEKA
ncbi:uncharacterized protein LOC123696240 [Colias croceus]|uniref:uncharacterized protein LOC123696240 n=1 Tax=Colias crocea TaxID=72248 RepID=UPI001E27DC4A|nr:uncharacterized protein LOC123696240 [Colias croceus]